MIDLRVLRTDPELARESQRRRGEPPELVDALLSADENRRTAVTNLDTLRAQQKAASSAVRTATPNDRPALIARGRQLSDDVKAAEERLRTADIQLRSAQLQLPNLVEPDVPPGGEQDFRTLATVGVPPDLAAPRDHVDIGTELGAVDLERGAKVSGSRFYFLTGVGAQLELALVNLAMAYAAERGLTPVIAPALVRPEIMEGTGFLGSHADEVYRLAADELYLVGTSEVALAGMHSDEILTDLPLRYAGFSSCFRREAGSHGKDTRGLVRVHWFDKVEMFSYVTGDDPAVAQAEHRQLLAWQQGFLDQLELAYRVIDVAAGDLGTSAARKFDIEAWFPSQGRYRELTSASNCTTFQARRLGIRSKGSGSSGPPGNVAVATLNGTLCAVARTIACLLDFHQRPDGSVHVPKALRPWLGGRDSLEPYRR